jgi:hypothetical protein
MSKVINLFGGPGAGKSTTATGLFHVMKSHGDKVELVTEFAKELVYDMRSNAINCQPYVFGEQLYRVERLINKCDYIITDSPILLSIIYNKLNTKPYDKFEEFILSTYCRFDNINILLDRGSKDFQQYGRNQNINEAKEIDNNIQLMLDKYGITYIDFKYNKSNIDSLIELRKTIYDHYNY